MQTLFIPEHLRNRGIDTLGLSRFARNRLRVAGVQTLGQLHGKSIAEIGAFPGVGAKCLDEIVTAAQAAAEVSAGTIDSFPQEPENVVREHITPTRYTRVEDCAMRVAEAAAQWPLQVLDIPKRSIQILSKSGITLVGSLNGLTQAELASLGGIGDSGAQAIADAVAHIEPLPSPSVLRRNKDGSLTAPSAPVSLLRRVDQAHSPAEELEAILHGQSPRTAQIARLRWARVKGKQHTLEEIAQTFGVSRERVRQIMSKLDSQLRESNIRLPKLTRAIEVLESEDGALPTHRLIKRASSSGFPLDFHLLWYVEALGQLGLIPVVRYDDRSKLWLTPRGERIWVPGGHLAKPLDDTIRSMHRSLRQIGCIPLKKARRSPFGVRHALSLALKHGTRMERVGDYLVPRHPSNSKLTRAVSKMLAVTSELSFSEVVNGLRKLRVVYRGHRSRVEVPSELVIRELLRRDPTFIVSGDSIRRANPVSRDQVLTPTEEVVVTRMEELNNVATWDQILEAGKAADRAVATVTLVLGAPFIVKRGAGIYALRGRRVAPEDLRARQKERAASRRDTVRRVSYTGGTRARVVYELTTFSISGVLPVPNKMKALASRSWVAKLPGGRETNVKMRGGFIWSLARWFTSDNLKRGDLIVADFDIENGIIHFDIAT